MSDEVLDDVMLKGNCKGKADAIVNCQCNIETAPSRCEQAEHCFIPIISVAGNGKDWHNSWIPTMRKGRLLIGARTPMQRSFLLFKI